QHRPRFRYGHGATHGAADDFPRPSLSVAPHYAGDPAVKAVTQRNTKSWHNLDNERSTKEAYESTGGWRYWADRTVHRERIVTTRLSGRDLSSWHARNP